jgi:acetoin utilization protein AcuB
MSRPPQTIGPEVPASEAALVLEEERIGALPVVEGGHLVGILTHSDFLRYLVGYSEPVRRTQAIAQQVAI